MGFPNNYFYYFIFYAVTIEVSETDIRTIVHQLYHSLRCKYYNMSPYHIFSQIILLGFFRSRERETKHFPFSVKDVKIRFVEDICY